MGNFAMSLHYEGLYVIVVRLELMLNFNDYVGFDDFGLKLPRVAGVCDPCGVKTPLTFALFTLKSGVIVHFC